MKKTLLSLILLPLVVVSNTSSTNVETVVKTEATGGNASVKTEISTIVDGKETRIESSQPGEIRVKVKDGKTEIESNPEISPIVTISKSIETFPPSSEVKQRLFSLFENLFSRIFRIFRFKT